MRRRALAGLALILAAGGMAACTSSAYPSPASQVAAQRLHRSTVCDDLQDGKGTGSALSALPGKTPRAGQQATVQPISVAWRVCYNNATEVLWLASDPGLCATATDGIVAWDGCGQDGQIWNEVPQVGGGYEFRNPEPGPNADICPTDGPGSKVIAAARSACTPYHRTFLFHQAAKHRHPAALPVLSVQRSALGLAA